MKWSNQEINEIRARIAALTGATFEGMVEAIRGDGLSIRMERGTAHVVACDKPALSRALFLLARAQQEGVPTFITHQTRHIASCGPFLDFSRGAVMTVRAVKRVIDALTALGMNLLVLYMEDTYQVPEYPYFGHLRGRYSPEELIEIDRYAAEMGVELVPCIQTLAHLGQFLQWRDNEHLKDTQYCLMIDDEKTYDFVEAEIRAMRRYMRGKRIHIGMDEAHGVGLGRYFERHGLVDRFDLLRRHLERVIEICKKYGFEPMMWSDMFFRLGSATGEYYDPNASIPQHVLDTMPSVAMVYWDYYHDDEAVYDRMLAEHARMGPGTVFAGGIWTWAGFLPHADLTEATAIPALHACLRHNIQTVLATTWGDDGNETDFFLALSLLPLYAEACWQGMDFDPAECARVGAFLSRIPEEAFHAFSLGYSGPVDDRTMKGLIYCDPLYPLLPGSPPLADWAARFARACEVLQPFLENDACRYADALFAVAGAKASLLLDIRQAYQALDLDALLEVVDVKIPVLLAQYEELIALHRVQWEASYKRNGWETFALRYGAVMGRLRDVENAVRRFVEGKLDALSELEEPALDATRRASMQWFDVYKSPML